MVPSTFAGLPLHPLIVHATVVAVPAAALAVALSVCWPRFRRWAGPLPMVLSGIGLLLVPITTATGENLEHALPHTELIEEHAHLADQLLPFMIALFVTAAAHWWLTRWRPDLSRLTAIVAVIAVLLSVGTLVEVARIGHSGAKAAWSQTASR